MTVGESYEAVARGRSPLDEHLNPAGTTTVPINSCAKAGLALVRRKMTSSGR